MQILAPALQVTRKPALFNFFFCRVFALLPNAASFAQLAMEQLRCSPGQGNRALGRAFLHRERQTIPGSGEPPLLPAIPWGRRAQPAPCASAKSLWF